MRRPVLAFALLGMLVAPAAGAGRLRPHSHLLPALVQQETTVEVEVNESALLRCPAGYKLVGAFWQLLKGEGTAQVMRGADAAGFTVMNLAADPNESTFPSATVKVMILCARTSVATARDGTGKSHVHGLLQQVVTKKVAVPGGGVAEPTVTCPPGYAAIGGSFTQTGGDGRLTRSMPEGAAAWSFEVMNYDLDPAEATVSATCAGSQTAYTVTKAKKPTKKHGHLVRTTIVRQDVEVPPARVPQHSFTPATGTISCPAGYSAVGGGFDVSGHPWNFVASWYLTAPGTSSFQFLNGSTDHTAKVAQVCLGQRTAPA